MNGLIWNGTWRVRRDGELPPTAPFRPRPEDVEKLPPGVQATIGLMLGAIHGASFAGGIRINDEDGTPCTVRIVEGDGTDIVIEVSGAGEARAGSAADPVPTLGPLGERLQELAEQAVWVVAPSGATMMVNEPMARLLGSTVEDLRSRSLLEAVAESDRWWVIGLFNPAQAARRSPVDVQFEGIDGRAVWTAMTVEPLRDASGEVTALIAFIIDMSGRHLEEQALRDRERRFRLSFEDAPIGRLLLSLDGRILEANRALGRILGQEPAALAGLHYRDLAPPSTVAAEDALARQAIAGQLDGYSLQRTFLRADDRMITASLNVSVARDENEEPLYLVVQLEDITARKEAESPNREAIARFQAAFVHAPIGMAIVGLDGSIREANPALCRMLETNLSEVAGGALAQWVHSDDSPHLLEGLAKLNRSGSDSLPMQLRLVASSGRTVWTQLSIATVTGEEERPSYAIAQVEDITERRQAERDLVRQTLHDPLTGLGNRLLLMDQLEQAIAIVADLPFAVLFLDLDQFKSVNDTHGHSSGDALLIEVGERLRQMVRGAAYPGVPDDGEASADAEAALRPLDSVGRLGGDEFAVIARGIADLDQARAFATKVLEALRFPFRVNATEIRISASIGIVLGSVAYTTSEQLLHDADVAMYRAKDLGRDRLEVFDELMRLEGIERLETERTVRNALEHGGLVIHYQPVVDLHTGRAIGAEALLRLVDPDQGLLEPARFLTVAKASGLIVELGAWVLREVCAQLDRWRSAGFDYFTAWVNVSGLELASPRFHALVQEAVQEFGIDPSRLRLEFSEADLLEASTPTIESLRLLTVMGVEVGIDNFGTGSSLDHLRDLPVSFLKIDSSFTRRLDEPGGTALVEAIVGLGRSLDLEVTAEGVESLSQVETLALLGCGMAQGRLFAAPAPIEGSELPDSEHGGRTWP